ncbi:protein of unknown function [Magnetospirillum sp. XM-1]|nr:protein of unknown function [Magnetospirillum sp. XM-1]
MVSRPPFGQEAPMADMSPLRRRMTEDMSVRNLSPATQRSYLHAVSKFSRFFQRSPWPMIWRSAWCSPWCPWLGVSSCGGSLNSSGDKFGSCP